MAFLFIALGCISVIAMIGFRGFLLVALIGIGLVGWVASRSPLFDGRPEVVPKHVCGAAELHSFEGLPADEAAVLRSTCQ